MIEEYQIKGLKKLVNSSAIKDVYPMVNYIDISHEDTGASGFGIDFDRLDVDIYLNDETITKENMYEKDFDPHYLVEYHLKKYLPYFNIDKVRINFIVYGPNGDIITSWDE